MKNIISKGIALLVLLASCEIGHAQFVNIPTTINTPYGNVTSYHTVYQPMYFGGNSLASQKHRYEIVLENDSVVNKSAKIEIKSEVHSIKFRLNKQKVVLTPSQTKGLTRIISPTEKMEGIPADSCWLFLCNKGKINSYAVIPEKGISYTSYIQDGDDGKIMILKVENLKAMLPKEVDEKVKKFVDKGELIKALELYNRQK